MKLFGKKTLALLLALSMVMSVCVFAEEPGTDPGTGGEQTSIPVESVTVTGGSSVYIGNTISLSATVTPDNATDSAVTWKSSDSSIASVNSSGVVTAKKAGDVTITATAGGVEDTISVNVQDDTVKSADAVTVAVAYGTSSDSVKSTLAAKEISVVYTNGGTGKEKIANWSSSDYEAKDPTKTYTFTGTVDDVTVTASVTVNRATLKNSSDANLGTVYVPLGTDEDDLESYLPDDVDLVLNNNEEVNFDIGGSYDYFDWWTCTTSGGYDEWDEGSYTFVADDNTSSVYNLGSLSVTVVVFDEDFEGSVTYKGGSLSSIAEQIDALLYAISGEHAESIEITDMTGYDEDEDDEDEDYVGGTLYTDSECSTEVEFDDPYDFDDFDEFYFLPNGSGYTTYIYYSAWNDEDDGEIDGCIALESPTFLLLQAEIDNSETLTFDSEDFVSLIADSAYDEYDLIYIDNVKVSSGSGSLYYDYDSSAKKNTKISSTEEYYVDADEDDIIDAITYVPTSTTSGTVTVTFDAVVKKGSRSSKTLDGIYQINVAKKADITISAGKGEEVDIDFDLFEEFFDDNVSSSKKNYIITHITFSGAPASKSAGYIYADGEKVTKPNSKDFYTDDEDDGDYPAYELTYVGGTTAGTTNGTFTIYGKKNASSSSTSALVSGSIDFIVGSSQSLNGSMKAAETMSFSKSLSAFEDLGGNDNVYVQFTSLPVDGKLYYNYGTSSQQDVTIDTDYYLTSTSGKKLLKNVTFVPSYSSSKVQKTITMGVKAYNSKDKAVTGTINIAVTYAASSAYFYDVTTSTYADSVDFLYNQGITTGMTTTTFGLNSNVTRGQFVTFLYRAAGQPAVTGVTNTFKDVKVGEYYYNAVLWAVKNGITTGRSATSFDPNANVTHQELLTFLYRYDVTYLGHSGTTGSASYVYDYSKVDTYAQTAVKWAVYKGVIESGYLYPTTAGTRGTVALYLHRMLTL